MLRNTLRDLLETEDISRLGIDPAARAETIREVGQEMYGRLATFAGHLSKLGRSLDNRVETFTGPSVPTTRAFCRRQGSSRKWVFQQRRHYPGSSMLPVSLSHRKRSKKPAKDSGSKICPPP